MFIHKNTFKQFSLPFLLILTLAQSQRQTGYTEVLVLYLIKPREGIVYYTTVHGQKSMLPFIFFISLFFLLFF